MCLANLDYQADHAVPPPSGSGYLAQRAIRAQPFLPDGSSIRQRLELLLSGARVGRRSDQRSQEEGG